jgi:hypothetical protein
MAMTQRRAKNNRREIVGAEKPVDGHPAHIAQDTDDRRIHQDLQPQPAEPPGDEFDLPSIALPRAVSCSVNHSADAIGVSMLRTAASKRAEQQIGHLRPTRQECEAEASQGRFETIRPCAPAPFPAAVSKTPAAMTGPGENRGDALPIVTRRDLPASITDRPNG